MKTTETIRELIGKTITIKWGTSRGRDTYGYTTATLYDTKGCRSGGCNGGGYDMRGTVIGNWIASTFADELRKLKPEQMPEHTHWEWTPEDKAKRVCWNDDCKAYGTRYEPTTENCPECHQATRRDSRDGRTVNDGRSFSGLCFSDPNYDVSKAKLEHADGIFTKPEDVGKTLGELKAAGKIVDLDAIRAWYKQTSRHATKRHTVPSINGACGFSSVLEILRALGLDLQSVCDKKNLDIYLVVRAAGADKRRGCKAKAVAA